MIFRTLSSRVWSYLLPVEYPDWRRKHHYKHICGQVDGTIIADNQAGNSIRLKTSIKAKKNIGCKVRMILVNFCPLAIISLWHRLTCSCSCFILHFRNMREIIPSPDSIVEKQCAEWRSVQVKKKTSLLIPKQKTIYKFLFLCDHGRHPVQQASKPSKSRQRWETN